MMYVVQSVRTYMVCFGMLVPNSHIKWYMSLQSVFTYMVGVLVPNSHI